MIVVKEYTSSEVMDYRAKKYNEFLNLFLNTDMLVKDIWLAIDVAHKSRTANHIRQQLKHDGYNSDIRRGKICRGEWLSK